MTEGAVLLAILVISLGDVTRSVVGQEFETDQSSQSQGPTECQAQAWVRNLSKHQRRYTCWAYTLREDPTDIEPYRNQLEYGEETPPPPCLTKRGRQLCKTLCGRPLLELVQSKRLNYGHPWIASCVRTHLVNRCGPEGIHCWVPESREWVRESLGGPVGSAPEANLKTLLLPRCNFSGQSDLDKVEGIEPRRGDVLPNGAQEDLPFRTPFSPDSLEERLREDEARSRRLTYLRQKGFPSPANLRGEDDSLPNLYGTTRLPVNIKKWRQWPHMLGSRGAIEEIGSETLRDPRGTRLQLKFLKEILRPRPEEDMDLRWARYGYDLGMNHFRGNLLLGDTDWDFGTILTRSHNLYEAAPTDTQPFGVWGYVGQPLIHEGEDGAGIFLKAVVQQPEDYLRMGVCFDTPHAARQLRGSQEWVEELLHPDSSPQAAINLADFLELSPKELRDLVGPEGQSVLGEVTQESTLPPPTGKSQPVLPKSAEAQPRRPETPEVPEPAKARNRVNRSAQDPIRAVVTQNTPFGKDLDGRIDVWVEREEETTMPSNLRKKTPFTGLAGNLLHTWEQNQGGDNTWGIFRQEVSQSQVTIAKGVAATLTWNLKGEVFLFSQTVDLELTAPFSPAIDAMDDLTYHLDAQQAMKKEKVAENRRVVAANPWYWGTLQSLRSHPKFGEVATNLREELETFRLHELASMDHSIGMNGQVALHCQQRFRTTLHQQTFRAAETREEEPLVERFKRSVTAIAAAVAGVTGFAFGTALNRPHVGAEVDGLNNAVYNLHERTAAMMRAEALINSKVLMLDQGLAAVRRATLSGAAALAVCEAGDTLRAVLRDLRGRRVPADIFEDRQELQKVLEDVRDELLEPHGLELVMRAGLNPEQLLKWPARGYILVAPRASKKTGTGEKNASGEGGLGFGWKHDTHERGQLTPGEVLKLDADKAERAQLDVMDNAFRAHASHKEHFEGLRSDYQDHTWELKVKVQIPTRQKGSQVTTKLYEVSDVLLEAGGRVMTFSLPETLAVQEGQDKVGTLSPRGWQGCHSFGPEKWVCPRTAIDYTPSCGTELWAGTFPKQCLKHLKLWPKDKPHFLGLPGSLKYTAYVPPGQTLEVKCGTEDIWTRRDESGLVTISTQPLCRYRVMGETITILPPLKRAVRSPNVGVVNEFSKILNSAVFLNDTNWGSLTQEVERHINQSWTLLDAYEDIKRNQDQGLWSKVKRFIRETVTILITIIMGVLSVIMVGLCLRTGARLCQELRRRKAEKDLERERVNQQKLFENLRQDLKENPDTPPATQKGEPVQKPNLEAPRPTTRSLTEERPEVEVKPGGNEPPLTRAGLEEAMSLQFKKQALDERQKALNEWTKDMDKRQEEMENKQRALEHWGKQMFDQQEPRVLEDFTVQTSQGPTLGPEIRSVGSTQPSLRSRSASVSSRVKDQSSSIRDRSGSLRAPRAERWPLVPATQRAAQGQRPIGGQVGIPTASYPAIEGPQFM